MHTTIDLIRNLDGVELPAPGRWAIGDGHPVTVGSLGGWRRRPSQTGRTAGGALLVAHDPVRTTLDLTIDIDGVPAWLGGRVVTVDSSGRWHLVGTLHRDGETSPAEIDVTYDGVYRRGERATAWLTLQAVAARQGRRRILLDSELSARAPGQAG